MLSLRNTFFHPQKAENMTIYGKIGKRPPQSCRRTKNSFLRKTFLEKIMREANINQDLSIFLNTVSIPISNKCKNVVIIIF